MAGEVGILGALRILVDADTSKAERALKAFGGKAELAGTAIGAAMGGVAIKALRIGDAYDEAMDSIRAGTGATGPVLADIEQQFKDVAGQVTEDVGTVGDVIAQLHTRTGEVGDTLERVGVSIVDIARLTKTDYTAAVNGLTEAYKSWGIEGDNQVAANDVLLRAWQTTGVELTTLTDQMDRNGATLRALGFSWEESVALVGSLEQAGIEATQAMGPLRKALATLAKEGKDPKEALQGIFDAIKNAPSDVKATQIAMETFGTRGAAMGQLIREGRLDIDSLFKSITSGGDTVQGLADDTRDAADGIKELMNRLTTAVGPITSAFAGISDAMGNAIFLLPAVGGALGKGIGKIIGKAGPAIKAGLSAMLAKVGLEGAATALAGRFATLFAAALPIVGVAAIGVAIGVAIGKAIVGPEVEAAMKSEAGKATAALASATTIEELDRQRAVLEKGLADAEALPFSNFLFGSSDQLRAQIADIDAKKQEIIDAANRAKTDVLTAAATGAGAGVSKASSAGVAVGKSMAKGIRKGFRIASDAAVAGFGSVRDALQNPPKLRTKKWRLDHLQKQMRGVMSNLRKAIKVGDPFAIRYWETARAKVQGQQDRLRKRTVATMADVRKTYRKAGVDVEGTWADIKSTTDKKSNAASTKAVSEAQQMKSGIDNVNLRASGYGLMTELAGGIYAGIPAVRTAALAAAGAAAGPLEAHSPPKVGPLADIDKWGGGLVDAWVGGIDRSVGKVGKVGAKLAGALAPSPTLGRLAMAGAGAGTGRTDVHVGTLIANDAGIDELERRMGSRKRIKRRQRRDPGSPNGMVR